MIGVTFSSVNSGVSRMKVAWIVSVQMDIDTQRMAVIVKVMSKTSINCEIGNLIYKNVIIVAFGAKEMIRASVDDSQMNQ